MFPHPHQELTLSYMCEKPEEAGDARHVERDFLQLGKRSSDDDASHALGSKSRRIGRPADAALDLRLHSPGHPEQMARGGAQSSNHTFASSDGFTAPLSRSCSLPFSHNPSCSLTRNSTANLASSRDTDGLRCTGEGTNGSVHSRFRPLLDPHHNPSANNTTSSSFFPSTLPARPAPPPDHIRPDRILEEIASNSVPGAARMLKDLPRSAVDAAVDHLRSLIADPGRGDELAKLQLRLERRSDLTPDALTESDPTQLDVLVAVRTGVDAYLRPKARRPARELVEILLLTRCGNAACNSELPVEDCECKLCASVKGFCSSCTCMICKKFDCALSTCTWVGCDVCAHWCHTVCGIRKNLIRPGPSLKGAAGTTEVLSYCLGCGHASEMLGFAKAVFESCAKDWGVETLRKELHCVMQIFQVSADTKGKQMHCLAGKILSMLEKKRISSAAACDAVVQFLNYGKLEESISGCALGDASASAAPSVPSKPTYANATPLCNLREVPSYQKIPSFDQKSSANASTSTTYKLEGFESMESMVQFKQAEAALFQRLADEASREVEGYRQMVKVEMQKLEEEYARKLAMLCLKEAEERRQRKHEELKLLEVSLHDYYTMKKRMEAEMASLLQRMEMTKHLVPL